MREQTLLTHPGGVAERIDGTRPTACELGDPDLMFPNEEEIVYGRRNHELERAKATCAGCWFRVQCLEGAVERREPHGVWGGLTTRERESLRRRQYPRRNPAHTQAEVLFEAEEAMSA